MGVDPLIGLRIIGRHHHPQIPGSFNERLHHQGIGQGLERGQAVQGLQGRPAAHAQTQMGPAPFADHRGRIEFVILGEVVGQVSQPIGHEGAGHHELPQALGLCDLGAVQKLRQGRRNRDTPCSARSSNLNPSPGRRARGPSTASPARAGQDNFREIRQCSRSDVRLAPFFLEGAHGQ